MFAKLLNSLGLFSTKTLMFESVYTFVLKIIIVWPIVVVDKRRISSLGAEDIMDQNHYTNKETDCLHQLTESRKLLN